jgi:M6 family metalloprotease-like protein
MIDAVVMINTLDIDGEQDFHWAYRYWNLYTDDEGYYYEYDKVSANDYVWASFAFLYDNGEDYEDTTLMNTYTFIHEFGHVLGADDYYDTSYEGDYSPMGGYDIMDSMIGDHNPYTKFNYGWLTSSRLVVAEEDVLLTLNSFTKTERSRQICSGTF